MNLLYISTYKLTNFGSFLHYVGGRLMIEFETLLSAIAIVVYNTSADENIYAVSKEALHNDVM